MSLASRALPRRPIGVALTRPSLPNHVTSPPARRFATTKEPYRPQEVNKARDVPETSTEVGPKTVGSILGPASLFIVAGMIAAIGGFTFFAPTSNTRGGRATEKRMRAGRSALEREEGFVGEEETPSIRQLELMEREDIIHEMAMKEKKEKKARKEQAEKEEKEKAKEKSGN